MLLQGAHPNALGCSSRGLALALPQGRTVDRSRALAGKLLGRELAPGLLSAARPDGSLSVFLVKHRDIPSLVADQVVDAGVTSAEWVAEQSPSLMVRRSLDWCDTRVSLLVPVDFLAIPSDRPLRCVTEFPNIAASYLPRIARFGFELRTVSGSTEGLIPGRFDCAVDCVETGETAARHGLREAAVILQSRTVVVTAAGSCADGVSTLVSRIA